MNSRLPAALLACLFLATIALPVAQADPDPVEAEWLEFTGPYMDAVASMVVDSGNVYAAGSNYVVKFDPDGDLLWASTWDLLDTKDGIAAIDIAGDALYVAGMMSPCCGVYEAFLLKFDLDGNIIWNVTYGPSGVDGFQDVFAAGGFIYASGHTLQGESESTDASLVKFDTDGNIVWDTTWGGSQDECANTVSVNSDSIYIAGVTESFGHEYFFSMNLSWQDHLADINITEELAVEFGNHSHILTENDTVFRVADERWMIFSQTIAYRIEDMGVRLDVSFDKFENSYLVRYDLEGNELWNTTWSELGNDQLYALATEGDYIYGVGRSIPDFFQHGDMLLLKYHKNGTLLWNTTWGGLEPDSASAVSSSGSEITIGGWTKSFGAGSQDIAILKYDATGALVWEKTWGGDDFEWAGPLFVNGTKIYVGGTSYGYGEGLVSMFDTANPTTSGSTPVAHFLVKPASGYTGNNFTFNATTSGYMNSGQLQYMWDFNGDGMYDTPYSSRAVATHSFFTPGTHTIYLTAKDGSGRTDTYAITVNVRESPTIPENTPEDADDFQVQPVFLMVVALEAVTILALAVSLRKRQ